MRYGEGWEVQITDCADGMRAQPRSSIDAIVTSPPYADQRRYEGGSEERVTERANRNGRRPGTKNQSRRQRSEAPMVFAREFVDRFLPEMHDVLAPAGSLLLNLGVVMRDGEESPYADVILAGARAMGFKLLQRMIWFKPNGNTLSDPRFLRVNHEWVFWLAKSVEAYRGYDRVTRSPHAASTLRRMSSGFKVDPDDERYEKRGGSHPLHPEGARPSTIFECAVGGERGIKHPAPMALKLARHLVSLSAPEGAKVLDPFCGSGSTGVACLQTGRQFLGMEMEAGYIPECEERLKGATRLDFISPEQLALEESA